jgi:hypothetical protein
MQVTLPDGRKMEIPDEVMAKNATPINPTRADYINEALAHTNPEEYARLLGANQFVQLYTAEINRFLTARRDSLLAKAK